MMRTHMAMRSFSRDESVTEHKLAPGTVRRILGYARGYKALIIGFLVLLVVCWPLAVLFLLLYPVFWLLTLPLRLVGAAFDLAAAAIRLVVALFTLPLRMLTGGRP